MMKRTQKDRHRADQVKIYAIDAWNSLPDSISFVSLQAVKRTVTNIDLTKFLKCS